MESRFPRWRFAAVASPTRGQPLGWARFILPFALLVAGFFSLNAQAAAQETVSLTYRAEVKSGMMAQFEAAVAAHLDWREGNGDPWTWNVFQVVNGEDLNRFNFRSNNHPWADLDSYASFQARGAEHFRSVVSPYVENLTSSITRGTGIVWPATLEPAPMYSIVEYHLKPGTEGSFLAAVQKVHEMNQRTNYAGSYVIETVVNGRDDGIVRMIYPRSGWAAMEAPVPGTVERVLSEFGEDGSREIWDPFTDAIRWSESEVVVRRDDLAPST